MTEIKLKTKLSAYAKGVIPTKVSQLEQDIDYTTEAPKDDKIYARKNGEWENISTEQDGKLYVRKDDEWNSISTPQDNDSYVRKNDDWVKLDSELERKTYRTHQQITEEIDNKIGVYDTEIKNHVSQNYVNNTTFNTYKTQADAKFIDETELATELNRRDYVSDIPTANNKVYARKRGQWEDLDLENMGSINIYTPDNSGLISQEYDKEHQPSPDLNPNRNTYKIELNKWEGTQSQFEQEIRLNPITSDITITAYTLLKVGCIIKAGSIINSDIINEDITLTQEENLIKNDIIKSGSTITYSSIINGITPYLEQTNLEEGKFYYVIEPEEVSQLLDGGTAKTNEFKQAVDILTTRFQLRTDTKDNWETINPKLEYGEPG